MAGQACVRDDAESDVQVEARRWVPVRAPEAVVALVGRPAVDEHLRPQYDVVPGPLQLLGWDLRKVDALASRCAARLGFARARRHDLAAQDVAHVAAAAALDVREELGASGRRA